MTWVLLLACSPSSPQTAVPSPPVTGEIVIEQLDLRRSSLGESALIVTESASALIDVGNDAHAPKIREALERYGLDHVDLVVLTHFHADHIGGFDALFESGEITFGEVVWRGPVNLEDANERELDEVRDLLGPNTALCDANDCALPYTVSLGPAELTVFLADGVVATPEGTVVLDRAVEENARSLGGVLTFGAFDWLFAGDLTGGGKNTPDLESAVISAAPELPLIDVLQVNHHGISSSTNATWVEGLFAPGDVNAVVGANGTYLDAPSEEAIEVLGAVLGSGRIWVTEDGLLGNSNSQTTVAHGAIVIRVTDGNTYDITGGDVTGSWPALP